MSDFGGAKGIVLSTASILGGKNWFLSYSFLAVSLVCFGFAGYFLYQKVIIFIYLVKQSIIWNYWRWWRWINGKKGLKFYKG